MRHGQLNDEGRCIMSDLFPTQCAGCVERARRGQQQARPEVFTWADANGVDRHGNR